MTKGRPPLGASARSVVRAIRLTPRSFRRQQRMAARAGKEWVDWARERLERAWEAADDEAQRIAGEEAAEARFVADH